jgi:WD40 repeat protein/uncharacterized caspase-like protein
MSSTHALIIGNDEYDDRTLSRLRCPAADTTALSDILHDPSRGAFDSVSVLLNQSCHSVQRALAQFFADRLRDDLLLLYFSGHGIKDEDGQLCLAVKDTDRKLLVATSILSSYIKLLMDRTVSRTQVLILDCCYSGAFSSGLKGSKGARPKSGDLLGGSVGTAEAFGGTGYGRVVLTASDSTQYAWEGDDVIGESEASVFTYYLAEGIRTGEADLDGDGSIAIDELYNYVYPRVVNRSSKQRPLKLGKEEGRIVVSKAPVRPLPLPKDLSDAIHNPWVSFRLAAVKEVSLLLNSDKAGIRLSAAIALREMLDNDSFSVRSAAAAALANTVVPAEVPASIPAQADVEGQNEDSETETCPNVDHAKPKSPEKNEHLPVAASLVETGHDSAESPSNLAGSEDEPAQTAKAFKESAEQPNPAAQPNSINPGDQEEKPDRASSSWLKTLVGWPKQISLHWADRTHRRLAMACGILAIMTGLWTIVFRSSRNDSVTSEPPAASAEPLTPTAAAPIAPAEASPIGADRNWAEYRHFATVTSAVNLSFNSDASLLAIVGSGTTIGIWDVGGGTRRAFLRGHTAKVKTLVFHPVDPHVLVSGSDDQTIRVWNLSGHDPIHDAVVLKEHHERIRSVSFTKTGSLISVGDDNQVRIWDVKQGKQLRHSALPVAGWASAYILSRPSGDWLGTVFGRRNLGIWDTSGPALLQRIQQNEDLRSLALGSDGRFLAATSLGPIIYVWEIATKKLVTLSDGASHFRCLAFDPAHPYILASGGDDNKVRIWDLRRPAGKELGPSLLKHNSKVVSIAFDNTGRLLAAGSDNAVVWTWRSEDRQAVSERQAVSHP